MAIAIPTPTVTLTPEMERLVRMLRQRALSGVHYGRVMDLGYLRACTVEHGPTGTRLTYKRDAGHHTCGWLANEQYQRCWHLSVSFWEPPAMLYAVAYDRHLADAWVRAFFGEHCGWLWAERAASMHERWVGVRHWRLFADRDWTPLRLRGEHNRAALTRLGWQTWPALHPGEHPTPAIQLAD
jgi:hypothetical protein